jgi:hypothetical protein
MPEPIELTRLHQALESFQARRPRDLPENLSQAVEALSVALSGKTPEEGESPGTRAAKEVGYAGGTGVPLREAAKGEDQPSPGQRAARSVTDDIQNAAKRIVTEHQASAR